MDIDLIRQLAGDTVFNKGLKIMQADKFMKFDARPDGRVFAVVEGTQNYQVILTFQNGALERHQCDCPAADYQPMCKHAVATWLEYLDIQGSDDQVLDPEEPSSQVQPLTAKEKELLDIRQWLEQQPKESLVERLYEQVRLHPELREELALRVVLQTQAESISAVNKYITKALPKRNHLWEYRKVRQYFDKAVTVLQPVVDHLDNLPAEKTLGWCIKALQRLELMLETIDDSGGFRFELEQLLLQATVKQFRRLAWPENKRHQWLLEHLSTIDVLADSFADFLTDGSEHTAFSAWLRSEIDTIEVAADFRKRLPNRSLERLVWLYVLIDRSPDDNHEQLVLKEKAARTAEDCMYLAERWLDIEDELKAEDLLIRARQLPSDHYERSRIEEIQRRIDLCSGKTNEVWHQHWQTFLGCPDLDNWKPLWELLKQYDDISPPEGWLAQAEAALIEDAHLEPEIGVRRFMYDSCSEDIGLFYVITRQYQKSLDWAHQYPVSEHLMLNIVAMSEVVDLSNEKAQELAFDALQSLISRTNNRFYEEAMQWLGNLKQSWVPEHQQSFQQLIRLLESKHRRRPNFHEPLVTTYGEYL